MSRKRRLKKLEKQVVGLMKSVSRLEREVRASRHHKAELPARRSADAKATDAARNPARTRTTGRRATATPKGKGKRAPRTPKVADTRAKRSGGGVLSTLPS